MGFLLGQEVIIRYRGFLLLEQTNKGWLVRPERPDHWSTLVIPLQPIGTPTPPPAAA